MGKCDNDGLFGNYCIITHNPSFTHSDYSINQIPGQGNQGQGLLRYFYLGFVCCVLIQGPDIR